MKRRFFILVVIVFTRCTHATNETHLPYYCSADFTPQWLDEKTAGTVYSTPDFSFTDQDGKKISRKNFDDKITVVDFFFTRCPGICKKLTHHMAIVQEAFKNNMDVLLLSHSVTPEADSVPVLREYANINQVISGKWHLVTGSRGEIYSIARDGYFADENAGMERDSTTFLHTENILLIDKHHHIRGIYKGTIPLEIDNLIADIKKLERDE